MVTRLEAVEQRGEEERVAEARVTPAAGRPSGVAPPVAPGGDLHRSTYGRITLFVSVEEETRPVGRRQHARDEMRERECVLRDRSESTRLNSSHIQKSRMPSSA